MSKSMILVAFTMLLSFAVLMGMSTNISSKVIHAFAANTAVTQLSVGAKANLGKSQNSSSALGNIETQSDFFLQSEGDRPHGCHADSSYNPLDE